MKIANENPDSVSESGTNLPKETEWSEEWYFPLSYHPYLEQHHEQKYEHDREKEVSMQWYMVFDPFIDDRFLGQSTYLEEYFRERLTLRGIPVFSPRDPRYFTHHRFIEIGA